MNPRTLNFDKAKSLLTLQTATDRLAQRFYDGDHWQNAEAWMGPTAEKGSADYVTVISQVQRSFVFRNMVAETTDRHVGGVVGAPPHWKYAAMIGNVPPPVAKEAEALQASWLDNREEPFEDNDNCSPLVELVRYLLLQRRGVMRLFVPSAHRNEDGQIEESDLATSLNKLEFHAIDPGQAAVLRDPITRQRYGIYAYTETQEDETELEKVEICYVDRITRKTVIRVLTSDGQSAETHLDLGGRLTMHEVRRPALVREDFLSLQRSLNVALTMRSHNVDMAGFLATILTNAQLPGHYEGEGVARRFVPDPLFLGAGTINNIVGVETKDAMGNKTYATPGVHHREPVDVTIFDRTEDSLERHMLQTAKQLHTKLSGDAASSGESRKQALSDFVADCTMTARQINSTMRWLLETSLALASDLAGQPGKFEGIRANCKCRLKFGPLDNETLRILRELMDAGFASHELLLSESGLTDDVDSELQRIQTERDRAFTEQQAQTRQQMETQADRVNQAIARRQERTLQDERA